LKNINSLIEVEVEFVKFLFSVEDTEGMLAIGRSLDEYVNFLEIKEGKKVDKATNKQYRYFANRFFTRLLEEFLETSKIGLIKKEIASL